METHVTDPRSREMTPSVTVRGEAVMRAEPEVTAAIDVTFALELN